MNEEITKVKKEQNRIYIHKEKGARLFNKTSEIKKQKKKRKKYYDEYEVKEKWSSENNGYSWEKESSKKSFYSFVLFSSN